MTIEIKEYLDADGESLYGRWFDDLDARAAAKITAAIDKIGRGLLATSSPLEVEFRRRGSILGRGTESTSALKLMGELGRS